MTNIYRRAFHGCSSLTSINIPNSIKCIGNWALAGCSSLTSIDIPNSITSIGDFAFAGCSNLTSINIPKNVYCIEKEVFCGCASLKAIHSAIEEINKVKIGNLAFDGINLDECTLFIPLGTRWAYRHHPVFGKFKNIEIETKGKE